jgi:hypothetical protein
MTQQTIQGSAARPTTAAALPAPVSRRTCDPATSVTKTLLAYGVLAGPMYVVVSLAQALTREGFELTRHQWSLLGNGPYGWVQVANFVVTGLMVAALAVGLRRALRPGRRAVWVPRLVGGFGASLVAAGVFRADPALGFPPGTPEDVVRVSWHGMLHLAAAGVGFTCLAVACLMVAGEFAAEGARGFARYSRITGVGFLAGFVAVATGAGAGCGPTWPSSPRWSWCWPGPRCWPRGCTGVRHSAPVRPRPRRADRPPRRPPRRRPPGGAAKRSITRSRTTRQYARKRKRKEQPSCDTWCC